MSDCLASRRLEASLAGQQRMHRQGRSRRAARDRQDHTGEVMPYSQDVKELAYTIDQPCWVSYSGKPRWFEAAMDERRTKTLEQAQATIGRIKKRRKGLGMRTAQ